jgi:hypothetical protein
MSSGNPPPPAVPVANMKPLPPLRGGEGARQRGEGAVEAHEALRHKHFQGNHGRRIRISWV